MMTALLAGSALATSAAAAHADELDALKAQIENLNARLAAVQSAPIVPAGYQLIAISEGPRVDTPGLIWTGRESAAYGETATHVSVLPTADAPAGATITWSGYARAGLIYDDNRQNNDLKKYDWNGNSAGWVPDASYDGKTGSANSDISVKARGQVRATAATATAIGTVGVDIRLRANFNGNGAAPVYSDKAWGYWAMTPELTFGGGYEGSLGKVNGGLNADCVCYYTDNSDVSLDPGDTTQLRLSYGSGPFKMAAALEDASIRADGFDYEANDTLNADRLGAAGQISYEANDIYAGISGMWRDFQNYKGYAGIHSLWQVGAGLRVPLGGVAGLSLGAAYGGGPVENTYEGEIVTGSARNNNWWAVSGLASASLADDIHAEIGAGYMKRDLDKYVDMDGNYTTGGGWSQWTALAGLYYNPVQQLTVGIEGEWIDTSFNDIGYKYDTPPTQAGQQPDYKYDVDVGTTSFTVDFVSVWRF